MCSTEEGERDAMTEPEERGNARTVEEEREGTQGQN